MLEALAVRIEPGADVVEIGCGAGRQTRALVARGARVRALDISERMLELARELNPHLDDVQWLLGDGRSLAGIPDESADVCFSYVVFQHLPEAEAILAYVREMGRVLRPGGFAAFQVSNDPALHGPQPLRRRLGVWLRGVLRRGPRGQADPAWRGSAVDLEALRGAAAEAGMELERVVGEGSQFCLVLARKR